MRSSVTYLLFIFIILIGGCNVRNLDLSNYPEPFAIKGLYNQSVILVVGSNSSSGDTFAALNIAIGFRREFNVTELTIKTLTSSEVKKKALIPTDYNMIIIGNPCVNPLADIITGEKCETWNLKSREALIKLVVNGDKVAMLVAGTNTSDTQRAAWILGLYNNYTNVLTGKKVILKSDILYKIS